VLVAVTACSPSDSASTTTTAGGESTTTTGETTSTIATTTTPASLFPVTVEADNGSVVIGSRPAAIVSLSSVATEMLFEIGAGPQVIAVDDQSNYPPDAPMTDLSGFTPNLEAILSLDPDLVVISFDPGDLASGLEAAGVPVLGYGAALTIDDVYRQIQALGTATGNLEVAGKVIDRIRGDLAELVATSGDLGDGLSYYHEIDNQLYTVTSATFFGEIYALFGLANIADAADEDGSAFGYPQLSSEYIVSANPDIVFLADARYGESEETVAARPGWDSLSAVQTGNVVELDADIASRWGPRIVELAASIAGALEEYHRG
jgi:iron complex transport system substrate-binding protein